ncbi:Retrovirus-related Pol polyprotein from transposon 412 [Anabarilius grahami]|uniref:Retrovirus-related Pol polyprotein from transposon 412 n=1 Tax=Anabarilius grahami TaxID=495550 RepID=A0A3N0XT60_ANAGA|nr:Retrovirus-related Pol polyprotein from transposon 412 [Anabarilius grahami]
MLRKYVSTNQKDWDVKLPLVLMAIRATPQESTRVSPFELMTGRQMTLPLHLLYQPGDSSLVSAYTTHQYLDELHRHLRTTFAFAQQQLQKSAEGQKAYYDRKASYQELDVGDRVWYYSFAQPPKTASKRLSKKFLPHWTGPHDIMDKLSPVAMLLWFSLMCLLPTGGQPQSDITAPGPASGIVLREQPGLLITNCRTYTQKVYVRLDPRNAYKAHYPSSVAQYSWAGARWTEDALTHAEADIQHMLTQLEKMTVTQAELSGHNRRTKRFLGALLGAAAAVGTLFNLGMSSVNAVSLATVRRHVAEIQTEIPQLREQLTTQSQTLQSIGKTLKGTVVVLNTHSVMLNQTVNSVKQLFTLFQNDFAQTQLVTALMTDMLREVSSSMDSLAMGRIPPYLVPLSLVQTVLASAAVRPSDSLQIHLAYSLGSAILLHVDPEQSEVAFLLNLPIIESENIYRLKDVVNVGFWKDNTHIKIHTPDMVAYHDSNPQLYLAPNLRMCTLTKDIHYLCPSKPFLRDNTEGICGLQPMVSDTRCPAEAKPRTQVIGTQAEIVGDRWLVNTPTRTATLTYDQHDTATRVSLPNPSMWIQVPPGAILHLDDLALYHLSSEEYQSELEIPSFFKDHNLTLAPGLELRIEEGGPQLIDITPVDTALQALSRLPILTSSPIAQAWTAADSALCLSMAIGYALTLGLAFILFKKMKGMRESMDKCLPALPRGFKRKPRRGGPKTENVPNLIEMDSPSEDPKAEDQ